MRSGRTDFGMADRPLSMCQRRRTWAAVLPCPSAIRVTTGSVEGVLRLLAGAVHVDAAERRPRLGRDAELRVAGPQGRLAVVGVDLDLVDRRHDLDLRQERRRGARG